MIYLKKRILMLLFLITILSCNLQNKKTDKETTDKRENIKIEINFYSSSGGCAIYTINYYNDSCLCIKNLEPTKNEFSEHKKILSENEVKKIKQIVSELKKRDDIETNIVLDAWRMELIIDDVIYYNESGITLETLPDDVKKLLYALIEGVSVKISLYGFS